MSFQNKPEPSRKGHKVNLPQERPRAKSSAARKALTQAVMILEPDGACAEGIRALRTYIMAQHVNERRRALAICAASANSGCTFVAVNLAIALSQIGLNTLLLDGDLRGQGVEEFIPESRKTGGLLGYLSQPDADANVYMEDGLIPNLSIMYSGGVATNPLELLADDRFKVLMEGCMRDFDITIIDTPPANTSADARRISTVTGYSLIVARKNTSMIADLKTLASELTADHARLVGTVLNEA